MVRVTLRECNRTEPSHHDCPSCGGLHQSWRGGREAEGAPLLREYGVKSSIEGSNPSLSANHLSGGSDGPSGEIP
jgi:hypothetical protein